MLTIFLSQAVNIGDQGEVAEVLLTMEGVQVGIWAGFRERVQRKTSLKTALFGIGNVFRCSLLCIMEK